MPLSHRHTNFVKATLIILCLTVLSFISIGQNIVSNPNFSQYYLCPTNSGEINHCKYWQLATTGSSDYFNVCADSSLFFSFVGVPQNFMGYQESPTHSYAGVVTYSKSSPVYKEYIKTTIPALEIGARYMVTISVSLADSAKFASDGLGVYFYSQAYPDSSNYFCLSVTPQIDYTSYGVITDKINWTILSSTFTADSNYTHLVIGNYKCGLSIDTVATPYFSVEDYIGDNSYYYIDSVSVEKIANAGLNVMQNHSLVSLYPNPANDELSVSGILQPARYRLLSVTGSCMMQGIWQQGNKSISMSALTAGVYILELQDSSGQKTSMRVVKQ